MQETIQYHNERLASYYYSKRPEDVSSQRFAAITSTALRRSLDEQINASVGPGYQDLRNAYGALRSTESSVANAVVRVGQNLPAGLAGKFADMVGVEELAFAVMHGMAGDVAGAARSLGRAVAVQGAKRLVRRLYTPDRAIRKMFEAREKRLAAKPSLTARASARAGTAIGDVRQRLYDAQNVGISPYVTPGPEMMLGPGPGQPPK
jgi:hypothetical protein